MNILKSKYFWLMSLVMLIGLGLRLIFIDKPEGLWNDEYVSWFIASIPLGKGFLKGVFSQCHMPFYYLYLKFFMLFGKSDLILRLSSVLAGMASILAMYFVGKEIKAGADGKRIGFMCALFASLSSFLIYFSQEVRFYEVLFFFCALSLIFTLRVLKDQTKFNWIFYVLSNFMIIFTHTIGFVYVFFNLLGVSVYLASRQPELKKGLVRVWAILLMMLISIAPLIYAIFTTKSYSQWWSDFNVSKLGFLMSDYFSPVLINIVNSPDNFFFNFNFGFFIFAFLPTLLAMFGIANALRSKNPKALLMFYISLAYLLVLAIAAIFGKLVFLTKYTIEIYPILIALFVFGIFEMSNKKTAKTILVLFFSLNLFYLVTNENSAPKLHRAEGHKLVAELLKNAQLKKGDFVLLNYYPKERFERYVDFNDYNVVSLNKGNFVNYLSQNGDSELAQKGGKKIYLETFKQRENPYFANLLRTDILSNLKSGQKVSVVVLRTVAMYSPTQLQALSQDMNEYKKTPFLFLVFSYLRNQELDEFLKTLSISRFEQKGNWSVITFEKR